MKVEKKLTEWDLISPKSFDQFLNEVQFVYSTELNGLDFLSRDDVIYLIKTKGSG